MKTERYKGTYNKDRRDRVALLKFMRKRVSNGSASETEINFINRLDKKIEKGLEINDAQDRDRMGRRGAQAIEMDNMKRLERMNKSLVGRLLKKLKGDD